jgi:hypothetical protein
VTITGETVILGNKDVLFRFPSRKSRDAFLVWLSEQGEQDYWMWMDEDPKLTVTFDYSQAFAAGDGNGPKDSAAIIPCELCEE